MKKVISYLMMLALVLSCGTRKKAAESASDRQVESKAAVQEAPVSRPAGKGAVPKRDFGGREGVAIDLLRIVSAKAGPEENVVVSPHGVGVALSMLQEGAGGDTWTAIGKALRSQRYADQPFYTDSLNIVESANSVWIRDGFSVYDDYKNVLSESYRAQVEVRDFSSPELPKEINRWCSLQTRGRIPSIIGKVDPLTVMYLINALYFKAPWQYPFSESSTMPEKFYGAGGTEIAQLMHRSAKFGYVEKGGCQIALLPYKGWNYGMLVVLPSVGSSPDKVLSQATFADWREVRESLSYDNKVILSLPKFRLEQSHLLNSAISEMGAGEIFSPLANLSRISREQLSVSQVLQKCFIEVGEKGTEAAAVTAVAVGLTSAAPVVSNPVVMRVDRPFLFAIVDMRDFDILFAGKIASVE